MASTSKAELISAAKLSVAVDKAVAIAVERHGVVVNDKNIILNWELIGRVLRNATLANSFATDVAGSVSKTIGQKLQPATLQVGKQIWCGFYERNRLPVQREFL